MVFHCTILNSEVALLSKVVWRLKSLWNLLSHHWHWTLISWRSTPLRSMARASMVGYSVNVAFEDLCWFKPAKGISYDEKSQRINVTLPGKIGPSPKTTLQIYYSGSMNNNMAGFYRSKYKPQTQPSKSVPMEGDSHLMFSTQFESSDARKAFPCFDEPNLKASSFCHYHIKCWPGMPSFEEDMGVI